jgi:hypothetical protein
MINLSPLPLVLAGPTLRRTSASDLWVWFALSSPIPSIKGYPALVVECYLADDLPATSEVLLKSNTKKAIGTGKIQSATDEGLNSRGHIYCHALKNLHIYLVKVSPHKQGKLLKFPCQKLLCYELFIYEKVSAKVNGVSKQTVVRRGFHEHLYCEAEDWKNGGVKSIDLPIGLRGYAAQQSEGDSKGDWDCPPINPDSMFHFDRKWLRKYSALWDNLKDGKVKSPAGGLPITLISDENQNAHFWTGSCFKLHGEGESATFLMHDDRGNTAGKKRSTSALVSAISNAQRPSAPDNHVSFPQALILTGDQIYADDVPFSLIDAISKFAEMLGEEEEPVNGKTILKGLSPSKRLELTKLGNSYTPFSTDGVFNHVLTFAEYLAYHLMHVNAALWPELDSDLREGALRLSRSVLSDSKAHFIIKSEMSSLKSSRDAVRTYSVVQSCIPTYALCDDHDVTDDWFLDGKWMKGILDPLNKFRENGNAQHSEVGCRLISNALGAYAVMHGLGNDPVRFKERSSEARRFEKLKYSQAFPEYSRLRRMLDLGDWSFVVPLSNRQALCLDTRTYRIPAQWIEATKKGKEYASPFYGASDSKDLDYWAYHLRYRREITHGVADDVHVTREVIGTTKVEFDVLLYRDRVLEELLTLIGPSESMILITPSPVCAIDIVEDRKKLVIWKNRYEVDAELWRNNLSNFYRLFEVLSAKGIKHCVIVSGDVHNAFRRNVEISAFGSTTKGIYDFKELSAAKGKTLNFYQIVSSPLLNQNTSSIQRDAASPSGQHRLASIAHVSFSNQPEQYVAIEEIDDWKKSVRAYRESTFPFRLKVNKRKSEVDTDEVKKALPDQEYFVFENNFASISVPKSLENDDVLVKYYFGK